MKRGRRKGAVKKFTKEGQERCRRYLEEKKKVRIEIEIDVNMQDVRREGTSFQGCLPDETTYAEVVEVFGEPNSCADSKTQVEWKGIVNGLVFVIYDYKSGVCAPANTDWHIGGCNHMVNELINAYFAQRR